MSAIRAAKLDDFERLGNWDPHTLTALIQRALEQHREDRLALKRKARWARVEVDGELAVERRHERAKKAAVVRWSRR